MCLDYFQMRFREPSFKFDWILLNCGLHDIRREVTPPYALQTPPEKYEANLTAILRLMQEHRQRLCWITSTPAFEEVHNKPGWEFHRYAADLRQYNEIAERLFRDNGIPIIDLYAYTLPHCPEAFDDHVHFKEPMRAMQAEFLERELKRIFQ